MFLLYKLVSYLVGFLVPGKIYRFEKRIERYLTASSSTISRKDQSSTVLHVWRHVVHNQWCQMILWLVNEIQHLWRSCRLSVVFTPSWIMSHSFILALQTIKPVRSCCLLLGLGIFCPTIQPQVDPNKTRQGFIQIPKALQGLRPRHQCLVQSLSLVRCESSHMFLRYWKHTRHFHPPKIHPPNPVVPMFRQVTWSWTYSPPPHAPLQHSGSWSPPANYGSNFDTSLSKKADSQKPCYII